MTELGAWFFNRIESCRINLLFLSTAHLQHVKTSEALTWQNRRQRLQFFWSHRRNVEAKFRCVHAWSSNSVVLRQWRIRGIYKSIMLHVHIVRHIQLFWIICIYTAWRWSFVTNKMWMRNCFFCADMHDASSTFIFSAVTMRFGIVKTNR